MDKAGLAFAAFLLLSGTLAAPAQELRIGLADDADVLDPDQSRTLVGRIVFAALCDKLVDAGPDLEIVPMLATGWEWNEDGTALTLRLRDDVVFHDGEPFDAEAVAYNIERSRTLPESRRGSELASVTGTEVLGEHEIRIELAEPDATLLAQLADRSGMMISPAAALTSGADFGAKPVCSGPFRFVERVAQDRIVVEKFPDYYAADEIALQRVVYLAVPDPTVRLANLRAGEFGIIERLAPIDLASVEDDAELAVARAVSLGYQGLVVNVGNGSRADNPLGADPRLRSAFSLAIDRDAINQVVFAGAFAAGSQPFPPGSFWYNAALPVPARDPAAARALIEAAGHDRVPVELQVTNAPEYLQVAQMIQAMAGEVGFDVSIVAREFTTLLDHQTAGDFQVSQSGWSGRIDPDGNMHPFLSCGGGINDSGYCTEEMDALLESARKESDRAARKTRYDGALKLLMEDLPIIYLYHQTWLWALSERVRGFSPHPDGIIRLQGVSLAK